MLSYRINEASGRLLLTAVIYAIMDTDYKYIVVVEFYVIFFQEPTLITRPAASSGDISANARHDLPEW